jgi:hypothetical protein
MDFWVECVNLTVSKPSLSQPLVQRGAIKKGLAQSSEAPDGDEANLFEDSDLQPVIPLRTVFKRPRHQRY